jgi:hypothetical protein
MHSHFTMTFPSISPHLRTLHILATVHFTSLHFIFGWFLPHLHFALFITFLTLFLKLLYLQEKVPKASAGSCPTYKGIFSDICLLLPAPNFPIIDRPYSDSMVFVMYHISPSKPVLPCTLWREHVCLLSLRCVKVSQFESFLWCANFSAMFCTL